MQFADVLSKTLQGEGKPPLNVLAKPAAGLYFPATDLDLHASS
jgi:hypothetical protein